MHGLTLAVPDALAQERMAQAQMAASALQNFASLASNLFTQHVNAFVERHGVYPNKAMLEDMFVAACQESDFFNLRIMASAQDHLQRLGKKIAQEDEAAAKDAKKKMKASPIITTD